MILHPRLGKTSTDKILAAWLHEPNHGTLSCHSVSPASFANANRKNFADSMTNTGKSYKELQKLQ